MEISCILEMPLIGGLSRFIFHKARASYPDSRGPYAEIERQQKEKPEAKRMASGLGGSDFELLKLIPRHDRGHLTLRRFLLALYM